MLGISDIYYLQKGVDDFTRNMGVGVGVGNGGSQHGQDGKGWVMCRIQGEEVSEDQLDDREAVSVQTCQV